MSGGSEQNGGCQFAFVGGFTQLGRCTVFVMVTQFRCFDVIASIVGVFLLVRKDVFGKITSGTIIDSPFQTIPEGKFKKGGQTFIIRSYFIVFRQHFAYHIEVVRMSFLFVIGVHILIEHFQEARIFFAGLTVVDVLHGVEAEAIHTSGNPSFGGICYCLICR